MSSPAAEMEEMPALTPNQTMRGHTDWSGAQIGDDWRDKEDDEDGEGVLSIALSPNGTIVASGSSDGTVRLWFVETGKVIDKWTGHTGYVKSVCWSPDGERVVSGSRDGTAKIWDVESGETVLGPIKTGHKWVYVVAYSPDSTKIATGGLLENGIKIWDATTAELLHAVTHSQSVGSLLWTSDSDKLISGSSDDSIRVFDTATWQELAILEHQDVVYITLFSNNRLLVSGSNDGSVLLWDLDTNLPVDPPIQHECEGHKCVHLVRARNPKCNWARRPPVLSECQCKHNTYPTWLTILFEQKHLLDFEDAQFPEGFFDDTREYSHYPSASRSRRAFAPSRSRPLLVGLSSLFHRFRSNKHETTQLQQRRTQGFVSLRRPHVVEVAAVRDKGSLYVAPPRSKKGKRQNTQAKSQQQAQNHSQASSLRPVATAVPVMSTIPTTTATSMPETDKPSHRAIVIDNPHWWIRLMLYICL
ncbi:WD40-repeat-containing domain protein [Suillus discolor]|uniref:WD40-repeat-containing domain protein n=1 Tax=Suillus discolor TaxID=1912936 RepID=A0A9P7F024_9AGAM|nr:WD40-repeat-containing domain protein [Suillus discolor]KAG2097558.1 WD40-repeat-containing domain protein [Suillus discolor]